MRSWIAGIDIGGTRIKAAACDPLSGEVLFSRAEPTCDGEHREGLPAWAWTANLPNGFRYALTPVITSPVRPLSACQIRIILARSFPSKDAATTSFTRRDSSTILASCKFLVFPPSTALFPRRGDHFMNRRRDSRKKTAKPVPRASRPCADMVRMAFGTGCDITRAYRP